MSLTSRKPRPLDRSRLPLRDTSLVVVATEGEKTEKQYFRIFQRRDSRVQVITLETSDGLSAPEHVLRRMVSFKAEHDLHDHDHLFLAIDRDRWPNQQLSRVARECRNHGITLTVSVPCFEIWLYLHHRDPDGIAQTSTCGDLKAGLVQILGGYNPSKLQGDSFEPHVADAVRRARDLEQDETARWPSGLGTRVYRIVETIRERETAQ